MDGLETPAAPESKRAPQWAWTLGVVVVLALCAGGVFLVGRGSSTPEDLPRDAKRVCQEEFVPKRLKAPATAEFSGVTVEESAGTYTVTGSVDSQNGFGALIRSQFSCVVSDAGDEWRLQSLTGIN